MAVGNFLVVLCFAWQFQNALLASVSVPSFNDPKFPEQFYLSERKGVTMNIYKAWNKGYTGKNVTICIHDPAGVEKDHIEFATKFVLEASYDLKTNTSDPKPDSGIYDGMSSHGNKMAGLAAAKANNAFCGVGVAYDAKLSGIKLLLTSHLQPEGTQNLSEIQLAYTLRYRNDMNDIYSCSWTPMDLLDTNIGYMSSFVKDALKSSVEKGRGGKGNIYVIGNGNNGFFNGSCSFSGHVSSIYTISISVVTGHNNASRQNVKCASVSAVTYARDHSFGMNYPYDLMPTCGLKNSCVKTAGASSAATAVASGTIALVLQANPNLGWRDVQHLIARSSCSQFSSVPWITNKAGIKVSDSFGFGLLDADALTTNAKTWTNVGKQLECAVSSNTPDPIDGVQTIKKTVDLSTWPASCGGEAKRINYLEHVVLDLSLNFTFRRNIEIEVISPGGTKSIILRSGRKHDSGQEIKNLSPMSLHFWGESPRGQWKVNLRNTKPDPKQNGTLYNWSLKFYGTSADPLASNRIVPSTISIKQPSTAKPVMTSTTKQSTTPVGPSAQPTSGKTASTSANTTKRTTVRNGNGSPQSTLKPTTRNNGTASSRCAAAWMVILSSVLALTLMR